MEIATAMVVNVLALLAHVTPRDGLAFILGGTAGVVIIGVWYRVTFWTEE